MFSRKAIPWLVLVFTVGILLFAGCGGEAEPPAGATETAVAGRVIATLTAEANTTPTPSAELETVVRAAFGDWAKQQGEPYRDVTIKVEDTDGYFATVRVVAWFRPTRDMPWEEREATGECQLVGDEWQCEESFEFQLTEREMEQRAQATATTQAAAMAEALAQPGWTKLTTREGLVDNQVRAIAVAPDGALWFGTTPAVSTSGKLLTSGGVSRLAPDGTWTTFTTEDGLASNDVRAIAVGPDGALWFSTQAPASVYGRGVSRLAPDGTWTTFTTEDGLASNEVSAVAVAPDGALWFGTPGGVSRQGPDGRWQTFTTADGLADDWVSAIAVAPDGAVWFGTLEGGVSRLGPDGTWQSFTTEDGLASNDVKAIAVAPDGTLWFGTRPEISMLGTRISSGGVSRLAPNGTWTTFTTEDGLADNEVWAIAVAPDGAVWVSTSGGVSRYKP